MKLNVVSVAHDSIYVRVHVHGYVSDAFLLTRYLKKRNETVLKLGK